MLKTNTTNRQTIELFFGNAEMINYIIVDNGLFGYTLRNDERGSSNKHNETLEKMERMYNENGISIIGLYEIDGMCIVVTD